MSFNGRDLWAVILGGSSGMGLAVAKRMSAAGMHVCLVHRDRRGAMGRIERDFEEVRRNGGQLLTYNTDAISAEGRALVLDGLEAAHASGKVRLLLHSIAAGSVRPVAPQEGSSDDQLLDEDELLRTVQCMGTSLLTWTQDMFRRALFAGDARVIGLTSEGNEVAWRGYAAVSAAKAALEAVSRSIAREFAPYGIRSNIVQPGVTDTPALRMIPGHARLAADAEARNPFGRLTTPEDVASVVYLLSSDEAGWINGSLIRADGGERISG